MICVICGEPWVTTIDGVRVCRVHFQEKLDELDQTPKRRTKPTIENRLKLRRNA